MFVLTALLCTSVMITDCVAIVAQEESYQTREACQMASSKKAAEFEEIPGLPYWSLYCYPVPLKGTTF
jgi:hypothetical protein